MQQVYQCLLTTDLFHRWKKCMDNGVEAPKTYKIKLSGDGAKMSKLTGFIVLLRKLIYCDCSHVIAVIKGQECYDTLLSA